MSGQFHGQRSLAGYSAWGCKELDKTEQLTYTCTLVRLKIWNNKGILCKIRYIFYLIRTALPLGLWRSLEWECVNFMRA